VLSPSTSTLATILPLSYTASPVSAAEKFRLRLYWERGYYWQQQKIDPKLCIRCVNSTCPVRNQLVIDVCDKGAVYWKCIVHGTEVQIRHADKNVCFERRGRNIYLNVCDQSQASQRWLSSQGTFNSSSKFEVTAHGMPGYCMSQLVLPIAGGIIGLKPVERARGSDTSLWNLY
jgi:hypothetical protein